MATSTDLTPARIKCNREYPCQNCVTYNDVSSCKYEKRERLAEPVISSSKPSEPNATQDLDGQSDQPQDSYSFAGEKNDTPYRGETHWSTVVKEVNVF